MLAPETVEEVLGEAEVRALFRSSRLGVIAGCMVTTGKFQRSARVRVVRDGAVVWDGNIGSLRRVQEDVREVAAGFECGILLEGYNDLKEGDVLECYVTRQVERSSLGERRGSVELVASALGGRSSGDPDDRRAVGAVGDRLVDEGVACELVAHRLAQGARATAVDDADLGSTGEVRVVDVRACRLAGVVGAPAAHVELVRDVVRRARAYCTSGSRRRLGAPLRIGRERASGTRTRSAPACTSASSPAISVITPRTPSARGDHGIADARAGAVCRTGRRATTARRTRAGRGRTRPRGAGRARARRGSPAGVAGSARRARSEARAARISARSCLELAALAGQLALGLLQRPLARALRRRAHRLDLALQLDRAGRRQLGGVARLRRSRSASARAAARAPLALGGGVQELLELEPLGRDARARRLDDLAGRARAARPSAARAMRRVARRVNV